MTGSDLPSTTKHVLLQLSCYMDLHGGGCFPSIERLMVETSLGKTAVVKHLRLGAERGWITIAKHGYGDRRWARNEYKFAWPGAVQDGRPDASPCPEGGARGEPPCPEGGARGEPPCPEGGSRGEPPCPEGGSPGELKAVHLANLNSSENSTSKYIYGDLGISEKAAFEQLWAILPHAPNDPKEKARQAFAKRMAEGTEPNGLIVRARLSAERAAGMPGLYPCHVATWLAEERDAAEAEPRAAQAKVLPHRVTADCPPAEAERWKRAVVGLAERHGFSVACNWFKGTVFDGAVLWVPRQFTRDWLANHFEAELAGIEVRVGGPAESA